MKPVNINQVYFSADDIILTLLQISVILEMREVLNSAFMHPSRKNSPIITKVPFANFKNFGQGEFICD